MSTFVHTNGFTQYHYVQHSNSPRYPYGLCDPFATEDEATAAQERITAVLPAAACHIERAGFAGNACHMLATDNAIARLRLEQLRA